jgi:hypothetical protein
MMNDSVSGSSQDFGPSLEFEGYTVYPQVLTLDEVATLRSQANDILDTRGVHKGGGTVLPNAAAEAPDLAWIFAHPKIVAAVQDATGMKELLFTMEADLHRNYLNGNWHKDSGEEVIDNGYFGCDSISSEDCRVFKVALYLQDQISDYESLHVRPGSIRTSRLDVGEIRSVHVRAGDLIVFDVRITHRGVAPGVVDWALLGVAKMCANRKSASLAARLRRARMKLAKRPDRIAVYFAFGQPNEKSREFTRRNMRRQSSQLGHHSPHLPEQLVESLAASGIATVDF